MDIKALMDFVAFVYQDQPGRKIIVPYQYPLTFSSLAPGATSTQQLGITANADFIHLRTALVADVAAAAQTVSNSTLPLATILITDSGSNEQFMQAPVPLANYCTTIPNRVVSDHTFPRVISGRTSLTVTLTSYEAANTNNIRISLQGVLVRVL